MISFARILLLAVFCLPLCAQSVEIAVKDSAGEVTSSIAINTAQVIEILEKYRVSQCAEIEIGARECKTFIYPDIASLIREVIVVRVKELSAQYPSADIQELKAEVERAQRAYTEALAALEAAAKGTQERKTPK